MKKFKNNTKFKGTNDEGQIFKECVQHYEMATEDLDTRRDDWDKKDELFRSYLDDAGWPYQALVFDPRIFVGITEKTYRMFANKPRGRLIPREGGNEINARINNEILSFQWDDSQRVDATPLIAKWALMDMNTRKYGSSFALAKWHYQRKTNKSGSQVVFDGPTLKVLNNRDCLHNPSYSYVKNWFQYRDYLTLQELENVNDAARSKPVYKNLDILRDAIKNEVKGGDRRDTNYASKNLDIKSLSDYLGSDESFKVVEIITEYRNDRWITFSPKHGVIIRDIPNPYEHNEIPVIQLKYYPVDDDIYGLSEIEPVEKLQKGINALVCQYLDAINMSLYAPLKIRETGVQMHTLEFGPGKKWLMSDPATDVLTHDQSISGVNEFTSTYSFMVSALQNGMGESALGTSNMRPFQTDKTATEVGAMEQEKNARDNFNQIFLAEALKRQMMLWHSMNQQFLFSEGETSKIIKIIGTDELKFLQDQGLDQYGMSDDSAAWTGSDEMEELGITEDQLQTPVFPVTYKGESRPKLKMGPDGKTGDLVLEPGDLNGNYDYIADIESMRLPDQGQIANAMAQVQTLTRDPLTMQALNAQGYRIKYKELITDLMDKLGLKSGDKYFEKMEEQDVANQAGTGQFVPGGTPGQPGQQPGMAAGAQAMAPEQNPQLVGGPAPVQ